MRNHVNGLFYVVFTIALVLNCYLANAGVLKNQTLYFDPEYTGVGKGTLSEPYKSLSDIADQKILEGVALCLKRGTVLRESFKPLYMKGSDEYPVVFDAYGQGEKPVIRGTKKITGWTDADGDGIWKAPVQEDVTVFFVNGEKQVLARYPNCGTDNDGWEKITQRPTKDPDFSHMLVAENLKDAAYWTRARCVIRAAAWDDSILQVEKWDNEKKTLYFSAPLFAKGGKYGVGWGFYLENVLEELDKDGEWYYDKEGATLYYKKPANVDLSTDVTEASVLDTAFALSADNEHIRFNNLKIEGFKKHGIYGLFANHITVESCDFLNNGYADAFFSGDNTVTITDIHIKNSNFKNSYRWCIRLNRVDGYSVENNKMEDSYRTALQVDVGANGRIIGNTIKNAGYNGVHMSQPVCNNIIERNLVDGFCVEFTDGGAYYAWDNATKFTGNPADAKTTGWNEFRNNIARTGHTLHLANGNSLHNCYGIYLDDNSTKWRVAENIIVNPGNCGLNLHNTRGTDTSGNLFYGGSSNIRAYESDRGEKWWPKKYGPRENMSNNNIISNVCYINTAPIGRSLAVNIEWVGLYADIDHMLSTVDYNRYYNPFQDVIDHRRFYVGKEEKKAIELLSLNEHQNDVNLNLDIHSMKYVGDPGVSVIEELSGNLVPNSDFSEGVEVDNCWPRKGSSKVKPDAWMTLSKGNGELTGDCLKAVLGNGNGSFWVSGTQPGSKIALSEGTTYRISFDAKAGSNCAMRIRVCQNHDSKRDAGCDTTIGIDSSAQKNYTVYFKADMNDPDVRIVFDVPREAEYACIDNLAMEEVALAAQDNSIPLVNTDASREAWMVLEQGRYIDLSGKRMDNPIQVPAWDARIVIRDENLIRNPDLEEAFSNGVAVGFMAESSDASVLFAEDTETVFHGARSQKIWCTAISHNGHIFYGQQNIPLQAGNEYTAGMYLYPSNATGGAVLKLQCDSDVVMERTADVRGSGWRKCSMTGYAGIDGNGLFGLELRSPGMLFADWIEVKQLYNKVQNWSFEDGACTETTQASGWIKPAHADAQTVYSEVSDAATGTKAQKIECKTRGCVQINTADMDILEPGENYAIKLKIKGKIGSKTAKVNVYTRVPDKKLLYSHEIKNITDSYQEAVLPFTVDELGGNSSYFTIAIYDKGECSAEVGDYLILDDVRYYHVYRNYISRR